MRQGRKRRGTLEIRLEILKEAKQVIKPTRLMYAVNLSWQPFIKQVNALVEMGLLETTNEYKTDKRTHRMYRTTMAGAEILKQFRGPLADLVSSILKED